MALGFKLLVALCISLCISIDASSNVDQSFIDIKGSIDAGQKLTEWLAQHGNAFFPELLTLFAGKASIFLKGLGAAVNLLSSIVGSDGVGKQLEDINNKLKALDDRVANIEKQMNWLGVQIKYSDVESSLRHMTGKLNQFYTAPTESLKEHLKQEFVLAYEHHGKDYPLDQLYHGITLKVSDGIMNKNLVWAFVEASDYEHLNVQIFGRNLLQLFMQGIELEIAYRVLNGETEEVVEYHTNLWDERQHEAITRLQEIYADTEELALRKLVPEFKAMCQSINCDLRKPFDHLSQKYYYVDILLYRANEFHSMGARRLGPCLGHLVWQSVNSKSVTLAVARKTEGGHFSRCQQDLNWIKDKYWNKLLKTVNTIANDMIDRGFKHGCFNPYGWVQVIGHEGDRPQFEEYLITNPQRMMSTTIQFFLSKQRRTVSLFC